MGHNTRRIDSSLFLHKKGCRILNHVHGPLTSGVFLYFVAYRPTVYKTVAKILKGSTLVFFFIKKAAESWIMFMDHWLLESFALTKESFMFSGSRYAIWPDSPIYCALIHALCVWIVLHTAYVEKSHAGRKRHFLATPSFKIPYQMMPQI